MVVNLKLAQRFAIDQETDTVLRRTWAGWDPAVSDEDLWEHNRGRFRFSARVEAERWATLSYGRVVRVVAELTGPPEPAPRPDRDGRWWALTGRVLAPGHPAYDALVGAEAPWSPGAVTYLPDPG